MDFREMWLEKLRRGIEKVSGADQAERVLEQGDIGSMIGELNTCLTPGEVNEVITGCACHYPAEKLRPIREGYRRNGSIPAAMEMLRDQFRTMLRENLGFDDSTAEMLLARGMGPAGVLEGGRIVATKIPKSGCLREWLSETDREKRRRLYCHCPLVKGLVGTGDEAPVEYCLCGAGFYRNIWEVITEGAVRVEVLSSVMAGEDTCSIAIYPEG